MNEKYEHLNELQRAGLNILKEIIKICDRHNLKYYIYGGTLLGAIRHKGFIPWDDDVDIAMPRKDFERLKQYQEEFPDYMFLDTIQRNGHKWTPARIMDRRMILEAGRAVNRAEMNVWVDILIIDGVPRPNTVKYKLYSFEYLMARLIYKFSNFSNEVDLIRERTAFEKIMVKFAKITHVERLINQQIAGCYLDWVSRRYDLDKCDYCATLAGPKKMEETQPKEWFGEGRMTLFEDIAVRTMAEPEKFCTKFYGSDYMTPPPIHKRNEHNIKIIASNI
ncbi:MAG: LicD family protein [Bacteroidaceae bacterium]|nr:LicD family protein [Bacteroidaceae bacterium]